MSVLVRRLRRVITDPSLLARELSVIRDRRAVRRHWGPLLDGVFAATRGTGPLLIASRTGFIYQMKLEAMFAVALAFHAGLRPVAIVLQGDRRGPATFEAFGIREHLTLEEFLSSGDRMVVDEASRAFFDEPVTFQRLKAFEYHGAAVGRQVLSTISRRLRRGVVRLDDRQAQAMIRELLPEALRSIHAADALVDRVRPSVVLFNEKGYAGYGSVYDVALARGLNVVQFLASHRDDAFIFKRYTPETRGIHCTSISAATWARVRGLEWTDAREANLQQVFRDKYAGVWDHPNARMHAGKVMAGRAEILGEFGLDPAKKVAVLFSHVLWDANLFYGQDIFDDQEEWFVRTIGAAVANPRLNWIVKLHPANVWKLEREGGGRHYYELDLIKKHFGELPPHVAVMRPESTVSPLAMFGLADHGITIRGSIGYELPCFGAPVLTAGTGRYSGLGFTLDSASVPQYLERLAGLQDVGRLSSEQQLLAKRHAYALFALRPLRFTSFHSTFLPPSQAGHPLDHDLVPDVHERAALESAVDLRELASWIMESDALDYLIPEERW